MLRLSKQVRTIPEETGDLGVMIRAVRKSKGGEGLYCVMRSEATNGLMEIAPLIYARLEAKQHDIDVFGLAKTKSNAMELVRILVDEMAKSGKLG